MHGSYRSCFSVFSYFLKIFLFSCFFSIFLTFCPGFFFFFCFFVFFKVKVLNFQVFFYSVLTDPGKPGKPCKINQFYQSQGKVRDFLYTEGCAHILSFIFKNDLFFLFIFLLIFCMYTLLKEAVLMHYFTFTTSLFG